MPSCVPSITIGITCFNAQDTISRCLSSALSQHYSNFNVIVVDDFSTDNSFSVLSGFSSPLLTLIRNDVNRGTSFSRNLIITNSTADYICFLDDDDYAHPDRLSIQIQSLIDAGIQHDPYIVSLPSMIRFYPSGYSKYFSPLGTFGHPPSSLQLVDFILFNRRASGVDYGYCSPTAAFMTSRSLLLDSGLFDLSLRRVEDNDIVIRFCFLSARFVGVDIPLVFQSSSSSSYKSHRINLLSELRLLRKNKAYLTECSMYRYARLSAYLRFFYFERLPHFFLIYMLVAFLEKPWFFSCQYSRTFFRRGLHDLRIWAGL